MPFLEGGGIYLHLNNTTIQSATNLYNTSDTVSAFTDISTKMRLGIQGATTSAVVATAQATPTSWWDILSATSTLRTISSTARAYIEAPASQTAYAQSNRYYTTSSYAYTNSCLGASWFIVQNAGWL